LLKKLKGFALIITAAVLLGGCGIDAGYERYEYSDYGFEDVYYCYADLEYMSEYDALKIMSFLTRYFITLRKKQYPYNNPDYRPEITDNMNKASEDYSYTALWPDGVEFGTYYYRPKDEITDEPLDYYSFVTYTYYPSREAYEKFVSLRNPNFGWDFVGFLNLEEGANRVTEDKKLFTTTRTYHYANPLYTAQDIINGDSPAKLPDSYNLFFYGDGMGFHGAAAEFGITPNSYLGNAVLSFYYNFYAGNVHADGEKGGVLTQKYYYWGLDGNNRQYFDISYVYMRYETVYPLIFGLVAGIGVVIYLILWASEKGRKKRAATNYYSHETSPYNKNPFERNDLQGGDDGGKEN